MKTKLAIKKNKGLKFYGCETIGEKMNLNPFVNRAQNMFLSVFKNEHFKRALQQGRERKKWKTEFKRGNKLAGE